MKYLGVYTAALLLVTGCGRVGYDPLGGEPGSGVSDPGFGADASTTTTDEDQGGFLCAPSGGSSCPNSSQIWSGLGVTSLGGPTGGRADSTSGTCGGVGTPEITGHVTSLAAGRYRVDSTQSDFPHALYLLSGDCGGAELACSTDGSIEIDLAANETVVVVVDGLDGKCGSADVRMQKVN